MRRWVPITAATSTANVPDLASPIELDERYRTGHKPTTTDNLCKQQVYPTARVLQQCRQAGG